MAAELPAARPFRPGRTRRARRHQSLKTSPATEAQLVELRKTLPTFGSRRLIREFDLPISHRALERIWRERALLKKRSRKYQTQDLAYIKACWHCSSKSARIPRISTNSALLAAGPATPLAGHSIHRSLCPQRFAVLGLRRPTHRFWQRRLRLGFGVKSTSETWMLSFDGGASYRGVRQTERARPTYRAP
jgi:hypothetical protein